jgi:hypothetical protein
MQAPMKPTPAVNATSRPAPYPCAGAEVAVDADSFSAGDPSRRNSGTEHGRDPVFAGTIELWLSVRRYQ